MKNDSDMIGRLGSIRGFDPALTIPDEVLGGVTAPTLFLWGADDGFGGEEVARGVVDRMPDAQLVMMPDAGHLPWLDDPAFAADSIRSFFTSGVRRPDVQQPSIGGRE
jgi:pimeloyl-ACP methyl ester carboxylesterase